MNDFAGTDIAPSGTVFLGLAVVPLVVAPVVLLMKRSVAEKGAHIIRDVRSEIIELIT
jgi:hypothetical protein